VAFRAGGDGPSEACGVDAGSASSLEDPGLSSGSRGLRGVWEVFSSFEESPGSPWRSRSRSWVLPCSPLGLRAVAGWPSGSSAGSAPSMSEDISESASVAFVPVQSSCSVRVGSLRPSSPGLRLGELHPRGLRAPRFPLHRLGFRSPLLQGFAASLRQRRNHPLRAFRPRGFTPPRRLPPPVVRGLVASRCRSWGSPRFRRRPTRSGLRRARLDPSDRLSRDGLSYPSKALPLLQPHHVTVTVASLVFDPSLSRWISPSRRCSAVESVTLPCRFQQFHALSSLGFVPLQGPRGSVFDLRP
jgi:hypothetical protein